MTTEVKKCKVEKCKRAYRAKGYCNVHYKKWRRGELGKARYKRCHNEGCRKPMFKGGMCQPHFEAWIASKKGGPAVAPAAEAPVSPPAEGAAPASA